MPDNNIPLNTSSNQPTCLMAIVDEALKMLDDRLDYIRSDKHELSDHPKAMSQYVREKLFLCDLRDLLKLSINFDETVFDADDLTPEQNAIYDILEKKFNDYRAQKDSKID